MAKKEKRETRKQQLKSIKADISKKIEAALTDLKAGLGEKKFRKRLKKASAIFSDGVAPSKKESKPKKTGKSKSTGEIVVEDVAIATV